MEAETPPVTKFRSGTRIRGEDLIDCVQWPQAAQQVVPRPAEVLDLETVRLGDRHIRTYSVTMPQLSPVPFGELFSYLREIPWRILFRFEGNGIGSLSWRPVVAQILSFVSARNKQIVAGAEDLRARFLAGKPVVRISMAICTWGEDDKEVRRTASILQQALSSWGGVEATARTGDPFLGLVGCALQEAGARGGPEASVRPVPGRLRPGGDRSPLPEHEGPGRKRECRSHRGPIAGEGDGEGGGGAAAPIDWSFVEDSPIEITYFFGIRIKFPTGPENDGSEQKFFLFLLSTINNSLLVCAKIQNSFFPLEEVFNSVAIDCNSELECEEFSFSFRSLMDTSFAPMPVILNTIFEKFVNPVKTINRIGINKTIKMFRN